jgi:hypothetical protein
MHLLLSANYEPTAASISHRPFFVLRFALFKCAFVMWEQLGRSQVLIKESLRHSSITWIHSLFWELSIDAETLNEDQ